MSLKTKRYNAFHYIHISESVIVDEHALARTERKSGQGYTGFICDFGPEVTLEEDLMRRDLTINAIAKGPEGTLIDPYHGLQDLESRTLRHVSEAFQEDPLQVLRVARFAARYHEYGFTIAPETLQLMKNMVAKGELATLTKERVWMEVEKTIEDQALHHFLEILNELGALSAALPFFSHWQTSYTDQMQQCIERLTTQHNNNPQAIFCFAWYLSNNGEGDLTLAKQAKVPNAYQDAANDLDSNLQLLKQRLESKTLLLLMQNLDAWRRPSRLELFCYIASNLDPTTAHQCEQLQTSYWATTQLNVKQLIDKGYQGKEIKVQLDKLRLACISEALSTC
ncbi:tRNA nucleotidyltransferase [Pseudoalteromonas sp. T1lg65]|uniref:tRNA nucleotidyltransferase n=1 Tax=Pseudoalteromonas sp. T1lg65 TaxID=2077101 RepID=UPI003F7A9483